MYMARQRMQATPCVRLREGVAEEQSGRSFPWLLPGAAGKLEISIST